MRRREMSITAKEGLLSWVQTQMTRAPEEFASDELWRGYLIALNDIRKYINIVLPNHPW